jgi:hypothetical protein
MSPPDAVACLFQLFTLLQRRALVIDDGPLKDVFAAHQFNN